MKWFLATVVIFFITTSTSLAFSPVVNSPQEPYAATTIADWQTKEQSILGTLQGDPHLFELVNEATTTLNLSIVVPNNKAAETKNLLVVRINDNNRGVKEIARGNQPLTLWTTYKDQRLGMSVLYSPALAIELVPGTYRVEVSAPANQGKYLLFMSGNGDKVRDGYFKTLAGIWRTQAFFDAPWYYRILSSYVYYPLGSITLAALIYLTWRQRRKSYA